MRVPGVSCITTTSTAAPAKCTFSPASSSSAIFAEPVAEVARERDLVRLLAALGREAQGLGSPRGVAVGLELEHDGRRVARQADRRARHLARPVVPSSWLAAVAGATCEEEHVGAGVRPRGLPHERRVLGVAAVVGAHLERGAERRHERDLELLGVLGVVGSDGLRHVVGVLDVQEEGAGQEAVQREAALRVGHLDADGAVPGGRRRLRAGSRPDGCVHHRRTRSMHARAPPASGPAPAGA